MGSWDGRLGTLEAKITARGRPESGYVGRGKVRSFGYPFQRYWWLGFGAVWAAFAPLFFLYIIPAAIKVLNGR